MYLVLLVLHVIVTLSMIGVILIQRSAADGLGGMGGGGGGGFMTSRAQANLLTRTTAILATVFILNSLALSWLTQQNSTSRSIADRAIEAETSVPIVPIPDISETTEAPSVADELPQQLPAETKTPATPNVPTPAE